MEHYHHTVFSVCTLSSAGGLHHLARPLYPQPYFSEPSRRHGPLAPSDLAAGPFNLAMNQGQND